MYSYSKVYLVLLLTNFMFLYIIKVLIGLSLSFILLENKEKQN